MADVQLSHTADLSPSALLAVRDLLVDVFDGDFSADDWDHTLGGMHALVRDGSVLVGHASVVQRRLLHGGRAWRTGYVEGVGVRADRRGRGHAAAMMDELERVIRAAYDVGALSSSDEAVGFYAARGWLRWSGPTSALTPQGVLRTVEEDGAIFVFPGAARPDLAGEITCDWRGGDVW